MMSVQALDVCSAKEFSDLLRVGLSQRNEAISRDLWPELQRHRYFLEVQVFDMSVVMLARVNLRYVNDPGDKALITKTCGAWDDKLNRVRM